MRSGDVFARFDRWVGQFPRPWNDVVGATLLVGSFGILAGVVVVAINIVATTSAIGFHEASALYGMRWLRIFGGLVMGGIAIGIIMAILVNVMPLVDRFRPATQLTFLLGSLAALGIFVAVEGGRGVYRNTARDYERLTAASTETPSSAARTLETQDRALSALSTSGAQLIVELEATEADVRSSRQRLQDTLIDLEQHRRAAASSSASLLELSNRDELLKVQLAQLQAALGGQEPITRADLERSQWSGQVQGFVGGILSSLVATFVWTRTARWSRRRQRARAESQAPIE